MVQNPESHHFAILAKTPDSHRAIWVGLQHLPLNSDVLAIGQFAKAQGGRLDTVFSTVSHRDEVLDLLRTCTYVMQPELFSEYLNKLISEERAGKP